MTAFGIKCCVVFATGRNLAECSAEQRRRYRSSQGVAGLAACVALLLALCEIYARFNDGEAMLKREFRAECDEYYQMAKTLI